MLTTVAGARSRRRELYRRGVKLALVPTMGALHHGHMALVQRASECADEVWVSVFVNPTQFVVGEDFDRYPRNLERDEELLAQHGVAVLFAPATKEIYPRTGVTTVDLPGLASGLCGAYRPGHFRGVALVVAKLFNIIQPEVAVFGAKDWQQAEIVRRLAMDLSYRIAIEVVPTVREKDGLAMSSRNAYLAPAARKAATVLHTGLRAAEAAFRAGMRDGRRLQSLLAEEVCREPLARLQYAAVVDPDTLEPMAILGARALFALAVMVGGTRLIDNLLVEVS